MTQRFYKSEYTPMQWALLIDEATAIGCGIGYNKYGEICTIDSTDVESRIISNTGKPSDACCISWHYDNIEAAEFTAKEYFDNIMSMDVM